MWKIVFSGANFVLVYLKENQQFLDFVPGSDLHAFDLNRLFRGNKGSLCSVIFISIFYISVLFFTFSFRLENLTLIFFELT